MPQRTPRVPPRMDRSSRCAAAAFSRMQKRAVLRRATAGARCSSEANDFPKPWRMPASVPHCRARRVSPADPCKGHSLCPPPDDSRNGAPVDRPAASWTDAGSAAAFPSSCERRRMRRMAAAGVADPLAHSRARQPFPGPPARRPSRRARARDRRSAATVRPLEGAPVRPLSAGPAASMRDVAPAPQQRAGGRAGAPTGGRLGSRQPVHHA